MSTQRRPRNRIGLLLVLFFVTACGDRGDMAIQPRYDTYEASDFFNNGASARPPVLYTVARNDVPVERPKNITRALLQKGQESFDIHCSVCHGRDGYGQGMVTQRGYPAPPSYHTDRIRSVSDEHIFHVITNGIGKMPRYGNKVDADERWAIIAYIRALQRSQNASIDDVPEDLRSSFSGK